MSLSAMIALALAATPATRAEISAPGPSGPLKGSYVAAGAGAPVVLIIPGSGPTDRDGNSPLGIRASTYRLLAEGLAARGIASVRTDKRGMFGSAGAVPDANAVTVPDYVQDTRHWIEAVRERSGTACVWLLGHSEGGLVALATATEDPSGICGLILVAAAGRPLGDVLKEQLRANPANAPLLAPAEQAIDALRAGRRVDASALPPPLLPLFNPAVQGFLVSALALDPAALVGRVKVPVLILQGERDIQVSVADARALKAGQPDATLVLLPDTNHVLKRVAGTDGGANIATYADPDLPLAPGAVEAIADFVRR